MTGFKKYALIAIVILGIANASKFVLFKKTIEEKSETENSTRSVEAVVPVWLEKSYTLSQMHSENSAINVRDIFREYVKTSTEIVDANTKDSKVDPPKIDVKKEEVSLSEQTEITGLDIIAINLADHAASALLKVNGMSKVVFVGDTIGEAFLVTRITHNAIYVNSITE